MAEEVFSLHYITRLGEDVMDPNPKKVSIYVSYCPNNLDEVRRLSKKILEKNPAIIYFRRYDLDPTVNFEDLKVMISQSQVTVVLVTPEYLEKNSNEEDHNKEYQYLKSSHIPFLPIITRGVTVEEYEKTFGTIQYLDLDQHDDTQISIDKKLENYFKLYIVKDDDYMVAKSAFKNFVFLSYRKKDRAEALKLIDEIHKNEECQDIAIWYDEFLVAGEAFEKKLERKLKKCNALLLCVTPNLVNEDNYVREVEYKYAHEVHKTVLPIKAIDTSLTLLKQAFIDIPDPVEPSEASTALINITKVEAKKTTPRKMYALGLAYLFGIEVEINRSIALSYLEKAANKGYIDALRFLANIYLNGTGVLRDFDKGEMYQSLLAKKMKKGVTYDIFDEVAGDYFEEYVASVSYKAHEMDVKVIDECYKVYDELKKFKKIDPDYEYQYWLYRLSLLLEAIRLSELLNIPYQETAFVTDLEKCKKVDDDLYRLYYTYYVSFFVIKGSTSIWSGDKLYNYLIEAIDFLATSWSDIFVPQMVEIVNKITSVSCLSTNQKTTLLSKIKEEVEKYPDEMNLDGVILQIQNGLMLVNINNPSFKRMDEAKKLEQLVLNYHPLSLNDANLYSGYWILTNIYSDNKEKHQLYIKKTLEAISNLSVDLQKTNQIVAIKLDLKAQEIKQYSSLPKEEQIQELRLLLKEAKDHHIDELVADIATDLIEYDYALGNIKQFNEDYQDYLKSYLAHTNDGRKKIAYDLMSLCLKEDEDGINRLIDNFFKKDISSFGSDLVDQISNTIFALSFFVTHVKYNDFGKKAVVKLTKRLDEYIKKEKALKEPLILSLYLSFIDKVLPYLNYLLIQDVVDDCLSSYERFIEQCIDNHPAISQLTLNYTFISRIVFQSVYKTDQEKAKKILEAHLKYVSLAFRKAPYKAFEWGTLGRLYSTAFILEMFFKKEGAIDELVKQIYEQPEFKDVPFYLKNLFIPLLTKEELIQVSVDTYIKVSQYISKYSSRDEIYCLSSLTWSIALASIQTNTMDNLSDVLSSLIKKYENDFLYSNYVFLMKFFVLVTKHLLDKDDSHLTSLREHHKEGRHQFIDGASNQVYNFELIRFFDYLLKHSEGEYQEILSMEICYIYEYISKHNELLNECASKMLCESYSKAIECYLPYCYSFFIEDLSEVFKILDEYYRYNKKSHYLKLKIQVTKLFFDELLKSNNKRKLLMDFYSLLTYLNVYNGESIQFEYYEEFLDILSIGIRIDHEYVHDKDSSIALYNLGMKYIHVVLGHLPMECFYNFFIVSKELGIIEKEFEPLIELSNPHSSLSLEETMKTYHQFIDSLIKKNFRIDGIIYFLRRYLDYLNEHVSKDQLNNQDIKEEYRQVCEHLSFYYEKSDLLGEAYEYQELSKKYRS